MESLAHQQTNVTSQEQPVPQQIPAAEKKTSKKTLLGASGVAIVCIVASVTFGILTVLVPKETASVQTKTRTEAVDTPASIDKSIQSDIDSEQRIDDQLSNQESQSIIDDANTTQTLEGSYDNF